MSPSLEGLSRSFWLPDKRPEGYRLLPFKFTRLDATRNALVNAGGDFIVADCDTTAQLIEHQLPLYHSQFSDFEARHFLASGDTSLAEDILASHYRTRTARLPDFTALHIFVVTLRCDHTCQYCQVSRVSENRAAFDMSVETANLALEHVFSSPSPHLKIEFQGGEPLLNFELIRHVIERAEARASGRDVQFVITSNLAFLTDEILEFCGERPVFFSTSLDGPASLHNANRPRPGRDSYEKAVDGIRRIREALGPERVSALMTSTVESLAQPEAIVDEYVRQGFDSIFLRHISPYGFAVKSAPRIGYETASFIDFFKRALAYIIELNSQGIPLVESYSALLLTRILTSQPTGYVDLQSPSGIGIAALIYNYNGKVYAADEGRMLAEMGDDTFCLGNVSDSYRALFLESSLLPTLFQSMVEAVPMCCDCAFQLYCGTDPVFHHRTQGDFVGHRPTSGFCHRNMAVIQHLIKLLTDDPKAAQILRSWVR